MAGKFQQPSHEPYAAQETGTHHTGKNSGKKKEGDGGREREITTKNAPQTPKLCKVILPVPPKRAAKGLFCACRI